MDKETIVALVIIFGSLIYRLVFGNKIPEQVEDNEQGKSENIFDQLEERLNKRDRELEADVTTSHDGEYEEQDEKDFPEAEAVSVYTHSQEQRSSSVDKTKEEDSLSFNRYANFSEDRLKAAEERLQKKKSTKSLNIEKTPVERKRKKRVLSRKNVKEAMILKEILTPKYF